MDDDKFKFVLANGAAIAAEILKVCEQGKFSNQDAAFIISYAYGMINK